MLEVLIAIVVLFAAYESWAHQLERKRAIERERELLAAILAKDVGQYLQAVDNLKRTHKGKLEELKLENELAKAAVALEEKAGIPVR